MTTTLTYDESPSRRPTVADLGGGLKEDDQDYPPDPVTMPTAADANQTALLLAAIDAVTPVLSIDVEILAGVPTVVSVRCKKTGFVVGDIAAVDNGAGDTTLRWAAGTFPTGTGKPRAWCNDTSRARAVTAYLYSATGYEGVQVESESDTGSNVDSNFTVDVF